MAVVNVRLNGLRRANRNRKGVGETEQDSPSTKVGIHGMREEASPDALSGYPRYQAGWHHRRLDPVPACYWDRIFYLSRGKPKSQKKKEKNHGKR